MEKPISLIIKDTQESIIELCNKSGLSPCILNLIINNISKDIYILTNKQLEQDELFYVNSINEKTNNI